MQADMERIRSALGYIAAEERDTWLRMGMAVKAECGDAGFEVWDEWSQQDNAYDARAARDVWKSIRANGKVTAGTLFHEAKANGWRDDGVRRIQTPEEVAECKRKAEARKAQEEAEIVRERADTAAKAATILKAATKASADHPYLQRKKVSPVETIREIDAGVAAALLGYVPKSGGTALTGRLLVIPVKQETGLSTLELIDGHGNKTALAGRGSKAGGYWATERIPDAVAVLLIGEGVATSLSAREATGYPAVAALSAGNLMAVAHLMRARYPAAAFVILADLVKASGEVDRHAIEAAQAVGGVLAVPDFGPDRAPGMTDFNDMASVCGVAAVAQTINTALRIEGERFLRNAEVPPDVVAHEYAQEVTLIRASDISVEAVSWLWGGWLALGKLHILGGAPGTGKTTIGMSLAATVTCGGKWPDGTQCKPGNVVIWSGEDDPADTLVPRLALSGAELSRVHFIADIRNGNERRGFDPARDIEPLRHKLAGIGDVRLLIVDPIVSAVAGDSHKNAEVRRGLQPLVDLAVSMRCALLGITHFSKGTGGREPTERITGSLAFGALARVVLVAAKRQADCEDGEAVRLFCRAKSNIGPDSGGFEYDLKQGELKDYPGVFTSSVLWGNTVEGAARELLAEAESSNDGEGGTLSDAKRFLSDLLSDGPVPVKSIKTDADGAGYSWATMRRAQKALGVEADKEGMRGGWVWRLPPRTDAKMLKYSEDAQQNNVSTFVKAEHLRVNSGAIEVEI